MAKAKLSLPNGTEVTIEGTAEEVVMLLGRLSGTEAAEAKPAARKRAKKRPSKATDGGVIKRSRTGPQQLIEELAAEDYFKKKRTIGEMQIKLEERGHIYAQTSLSTPLLRLTKKRVLRRIKEKGQWFYVS